MKAILLPVLTLLLAACAPVPFPHSSVNAPRFSGRVVDSSSRRPVVGASIAVGNLPDTAATTDSSGRFITGVSRSSHLLGIYGYDEGLMMRFPPPKYPESKLTVTRAGYRTRHLPLEFHGYPKPFLSTRNTPIERIPDVQLERLPQ